MLGLALANLIAAAAPAPDLVDATLFVPDAVLDIRYATTANFTKRRLYPVARCLLLRPVADRLAAAAAELRARGLRLRIHDCYRPQSVQQRMWSAVPDRRYVADPGRGSNHCRGAAVDVSLVALDGREVEMPTSYDAFEKRARPDASEGVTPAARANREALRRAMEAAGFLANVGEWWHFDAPGARGLPLLDVPLEGAARKP